MCDLNEEQIRKIYHDITTLFETDSINSANRLLGFGARLLCISENPPEASTPCVYVLGWPEEKGDVPLEVKRYGA